MVSREELYDLVWSKPMMKVADQFAVSNSYMARVCTVLNVPRPERGYWAKLAVGKAPVKPSLPDAQPGDQLTWTAGGTLQEPPEPRPPVRRRAGRVQVPKDRVHPLIRGARKHFEHERAVEEGKYLRPYKKRRVDLIASMACLDKALDFANSLFNALEARGHRVVEAPANQALHCMEIDGREKPNTQRALPYPRPLRPYRPTVVYVGTLVIGIAVIETSEEVLMRYVGGGKYVREADYTPPRSGRAYYGNTWTTTEDVLTGRLRLVAYSPYPSVTWSTQWQETEKSPLTASLKTIIKGIEDAAPALVEMVAEAQRQAEIRHQKWLADMERYRRDEDRRKIKESVRESGDELRQIIQRWSDVMEVERFLKGVEERASGLTGDRRDEVLQRLGLAREFLGTQDPLDFFLNWKTPVERYQPQYEGLDAGEDADDADL